MKKSDFYYELPEELIAQTPLEKRDSSRLLHLDKETGAMEHRHFYDLPQYLRAGDWLEVVVHFAHLHARNMLRALHVGDGVAKQ